MPVPHQANKGVGHVRGCSSPYRIIPQRRGPRAATSSTVNIRPSRGAVGSHARMCSTEQKKLMKGQVWARRERLRSRSTAQITVPSGASMRAPSFSFSRSGALQW